MITLTDDKRQRIFLFCKDKNFKEVGFEFELDKNYKTVASMVTAVSRIYNQVKNNPSKYNLDLERVNAVVDNVNSRQTQGLLTNKDTTTLREKEEILNPTDIKGLVMGSRNLAMGILHKKLGKMSRSVKLMDDIKLSELATVSAILIDKAQILQGQSTENIAILSKNIGMLTPEEALAHVLKTREANMVDKEKK